MSVDLPAPVNPAMALKRPALKTALKSLRIVLAGFEG
jgi:hypothetical protein